MSNIEQFTCTNEEIDRMQAGDEIDALILNFVFGWKCVTPEDARIVAKHRMINGSPSCDISAAWLVVERLRLMIRPSIDGDGWMAARPNIVEVDDWKVSINPVYSKADTAPLAICRAALKTLRMT